MTDAGAIAFDAALFRGLFPEFAVTPATQVLEVWWGMAASYISDQDSACFVLSGKARVLALNQLTAHITKISAMAAAGETPVFETSASIDKVSVTVQPPPVRSQFVWWLNTTPYGAMLAALLASVTAGGLFVAGGAVPERSGFRTAGGGFGGGLPPWRR